MVWNWLPLLLERTAAVECCLSHGLRRRALGLFRSSSTTALLHKLAKSYPPAGVIAKQILEAEAADGVKYTNHLNWFRSWFCYTWFHLCYMAEGRLPVVIAPQKCWPGAPTGRHCRKGTRDHGCRGQRTLLSTFGFGLLFLKGHWLGSSNTSSKITCKLCTILSSTLVNSMSRSRKNLNFKRALE